MSGGGNWEFQLYRNNRTNSFVKDGVLNIKPTLTEDWLPGLGAWNMNGLTKESACTSAAFYGCERQNANPISSARINSRFFSFKTGRLEVRAKLPRGDWLWPAIWLLPKVEQIDLLEARGNAPGYAGDKGVDYVSSAMHWGMDWANNKFEQTMNNYKLPSGDFTDGYHTFGLVRTETGLYTYVDNDANRIMEVSWADQTFFERGGWDGNTWDNPWDGAGQGAPFNEEFYIIINLAVGGVSNFFPDGFGSKPWTNDSPNAAESFYAAKDSWYPTWTANDPVFKIDWVKVTAL
jgi:beta-glucanase (GH16 family)